MKVFMGHLRLLALFCSEIEVHCKILTRKAALIHLSSKNAISATVLRIDYKVTRSEAEKPIRGLFQ